MPQLRIKGKEQKEEIEQRIYLALVWKELNVFNKPSFAETCKFLPMADFIFWLLTT